MNFSGTDRKWMKKALSLAEKGRGYVAPNPLVGCVIVSDNGQMIGKGYHERFGQAHAEINALNSVKDKSGLINATVYVTLEPCSHHGKTPPCAEKLADLPVQRVVVAMVDPNPAVNGKGINILKERGKKVDVGLFEEEATRLNEFFVHYNKYHKPFVTLKIAQTLDGYISAPDGDSKWITGEAARVKVHQWRSEYDAVMVGRNTVLLDNPRLTVRHVEGPQPYRIVIDGDYGLARDLNVFSDQYEEKTIIVTYNKEKVNQVADPMLSILQPNYFRGQTILVSKVDGHSDLDQAIKKLAEMSITSVLVEPGSRLASSMIKNRLVDKLHMFISPKLLGGGTRSVLGLGIDRMSEILELRDVSWEQIGDDILMTGYF
ncbi:MAG TPA: bifunctional diaminohydroxyphosphoribosylaminopyrimidine deaminase/5-amino-6-(5-phosphoribosylamino)uracil reductase RibD [Balneolales bacterium]|nr:bifunctional diaminohydroxyphosphoribosylaminopyrimidine deaminase/5-amino-6-(5-phosphoribosylamino)uracil reductase RibD [Balneolales bacterium]